MAGIKIRPLLVETPKIYQWQLGVFLDTKHPIVDICFNNVLQEGQG